MSLLIQKAKVVGLYECQGKVFGDFFYGSGNSHTEAVSHFWENVFWKYPELKEVKKCPDEKESEFEAESMCGLVCESCGKRKNSVCERPNAYAEDVNNESGATHIVCDWCDYNNRMDI